MNKAETKTLETAELIGSFIEYWGFKKVHGRIWTLIFLAPKPVDANYLKDNLKISKALTSMSIKDLINYKVIFEVEKEKPGTQTYSINPDITNVILDIIKSRELPMLQEIKISFDHLKQSQAKKKSETVDEQRLEQLGNMVHTASDLLEGMTSGLMVDFQSFEESTSLPE